MALLTRRRFVASLPALASALASPLRAQVGTPTGTGTTLFQDVRIFDGTGSGLSAPSHVLVRGNLIERIATAPITAEPGTVVIAGGGRTLMPGLTDMHWHAMLVRSTPSQSLFGNLGFNYLTAGAEATRP